METQRMVKCKDGHWAPAVIICRCLIANPRLEWIELKPGEDDPQENSDYVCSRCYEELLDLPAERLAVVCMHCANEMRKEAGR